jgi:uncharacterized membrane protein YgaE (UPF0421/DUF939 family)
MLVASGLLSVDVTEVVAFATLVIVILLTVHCSGQHPVCPG